MSRWKINSLLECTGQEGRKGRERGAIKVTWGELGLGGGVKKVGEKNMNLFKTF